MVTAAAAAAGAVLAITALGEFAHARRIRRVAHLAFGPSGRPAAWTRIAPLLRPAAAAAAAWACVTLLSLPPAAKPERPIPEHGERHLILILDVSPSMNLEDAGPDRNQTRRSRADETLRSVLDRIPTDQVRISVVAVYTSARPVVIDTYDLHVVHNILNDLPLHLAFEPGKTDLFAGVRAAADLARPWPPGSTTLLIASDGDTLPDSGFPDLPPSVGNALVVGVGDPARGSFIDGHQSRQDSATLRQLANRLRGTFHDGNSRHLPSDALGPIGRPDSLADPAADQHRRLAVTTLATASATLALLPLLLALAGNPWHRPIMRRIRSRGRQAMPGSQLQPPRESPRQGS